MCFKVVCVSKRETKNRDSDMWAVVGVGLTMYNCRTVDPNWAPKEPVLLAAPIRSIYNLKFLLTRTIVTTPVDSAFLYWGIDQGDQQSVNSNETWSYQSVFIAYGIYDSLAITALTRPCQTPSLSPPKNPKSPRTPKPQITQVCKIFSSPTT